MTRHDSLHETYHDVGTERSASGHPFLDEPHIYSVQGKTPLMRASSEGHSEAILWLLSQGVDIDAEDKQVHSQICVTAAHDLSL